MKSVLWKIGVVLLTLVLLAGGIWAATNLWQEETAMTEGYPLTVNGVSIRLRPETICSFSPGVTDTLVALDLADRISCVSDYCDAKGLNKVARIGSLHAPDFKTLSDRAPSIAFSVGEPSQAVTQRLSFLHIPLVVLPPAENLDGLKENVRDILFASFGSETGKEKYDAFLLDLNHQVDVCRAYTTASKVSVLWLLGDGSLAATKDTVGGSLLAEAGFENAASGSSYAWTEEELPQGDYNFLLVDQALWQKLDETKKAALEDSCDSIIYMEETALERQSETLTRLYHKLAVALEKCKAPKAN